MRTANKGALFTSNTYLLGILILKYFLQVYIATNTLITHQHWIYTITSNMKLQVIRFRSMVSRKISNVVISISPTIVKNESQLHQQQHQPASTSVAGNSNLKVCQFCSKTYRDPKAFARHVSTAHPVTNDVKALQSVICDECNHEFSNAYMLNKHQATCCSETRCFPCKKCDTFWNSGNLSWICHEFCDIIVTVPWLFVTKLWLFLSQDCF